MVIPIVVRTLGTVNKGLVKGLEDLEIRQQHCYDQNTEKSPGNLRKLSVTQTPVRNHQVTLMWKTHKGVNSDNYKHKPKSVLEKDTHKIPLTTQSRILNIDRKDHFDVPYVV